MDVRLAQWRKQRMWTQRELAAEARVCYTSIARIEGGYRTAPRFTTIRKLSQALGVEPHEIAEFRAALGLPDQD